MKRDISTHRFEFYMWLTFYLEDEDKNEKGEIKCCGGVFLGSMFHEINSLIFYIALKRSLLRFASSLSADLFQDILAFAAFLEE